MDSKPIKINVRDGGHPIGCIIFLVAYPITLIVLYLADYKFGIYRTIQQWAPFGWDWPDLRWYFRIPANAIIWIALTTVLIVIAAAFNGLTRIFRPNRILTLDQSGIQLTCGRVTLKHVLWESPHEVNFFRGAYEGEGEEDEDEEDAFRLANQLTEGPSSIVVEVVQAENRISLKYYGVPPPFEIAEAWDWTPWTGGETDGWLDGSSNREKEAAEAVMEALVARRNP